MNISFKLSFCFCDSIFCLCVLKHFSFFSFFNFSFFPTAHRLSVCCCVYLYLFNLFFFPLDRFSPFLPLQAAVAATANTSTVTTVRTPGAPGGHPQGAPGSPSPGPASHNVPSVNEGTDWTDGYHSGKYPSHTIYVWRHLLDLSFPLFPLSFL